VLNTPHNPTGKVFTRGELELIAELCQRHDALALCDEVYEWIVFDGLSHQRLASLPGMWERTVTLSSAGKTFSVTGWKVGWAVASPALSAGLRKIHQWVPFSVATPLQRAVARAIGGASTRDYYPRLSRRYQAKRDKLVQILDAAGLRPFVPQGTYFVIADTSAFDFADDVAFCRHLTCEVGVGAIPPSAFYSDANRHLARHHARFCFCKRDESLEAAGTRLAALR
jgi:aspartate/methionine/tyrosine aminotransferase